MPLTGMTTVTLAGELLLPLISWKSESRADWPWPETKVDGERHMNAATTSQIQQPTKLRKSKDASNKKEVAALTRALNWRKTILQRGS
jgi:hypothetical protein